MVSQVKLIAEPWDVGPGGYQVGNFPPLWTEWNGKYRDTVRDFWRGEPATLGEFASRLTGSSDLYQHDGRRPFASINFVTAHDGFTLRDLVSYNDKHNEANGEDGNDGADDNRSWNCGAEGPTDDPAILALRARQQRNFLGHPAAVAGRADAAARRRARPHPAGQQQRLLPGQRAVLGGLVAGQGATPSCVAFTGGLAALRARAPGVPPPPVLRGPPDRARATSCGDIAWFTPGGDGDDRAGLGRRLRQVGRASSSTARRSATWTARGERVDRRLVPAALQRRTTRTSTFDLPGDGLRRAAGRSWWTPRPARSSTGGRRDRIDGGRPLHGARALASLIVLQREPERAVTAAGVDLPAAAAPGVQASPTRPSSSTTCAGWASARCTSHRCSTPHPARRTATTSSTRLDARPELGGEAARQALRRAAAASRARHRGRHRAEPHGGRGAEREPRGGGTCCATAASPSTRSASTSTGSRRPAAAARPRRRRRRRRADASTATNCVYYDHRFPLAPGTGDGTPPEVHDRQHYRLVDWRRGNAS